MSCLMLIRAIILFVNESTKLPQILGHQSGETKLQIQGSLFQHKQYTCLVHFQCWSLDGGSHTSSLPVAVTPNETVVVNCRLVCTVEPRLSGPRLSGLFDYPDYSIIRTIRLSRLFDYPDYSIIRTIRLSRLFNYPDYSIILTIRLS